MGVFIVEKVSYFTVVLTPGEQPYVATKKTKTRKCPLQSCRTDFWKPTCHTKFLVPHKPPWSVPASPFSISIVVACTITALMHDCITAGHHTVAATAATAHTAAMKMLAT